MQPSKISATSDKLSRFYTVFRSSSHVQQAFNKSQALQISICRKSNHRTESSSKLQVPAVQVLSNPHPFFQTFKHTHGVRTSFFQQTMQYKPSSLQARGRLSKRPTRLYSMADMSLKSRPSLRASVPRRKGWNVLGAALTSDDSEPHGTFGVQIQCSAVWGRLRQQSVITPGRGGGSQGAMQPAAQLDRHLCLGSAQLYNNKSQSCDSTEILQLPAIESGGVSRNPQGCWWPTGHNPLF